jgi:DHA2 family multidrug resistance protein
MLGAAAAPLRRQALALIDGAVHRQALLLAYGGAFLIAGLAMLVCAAGGMLLKGKKTTRL